MSLTGVEATIDSTCATRLALWASEKTGFMLERECRRETAGRPLNLRPVNRYARLHAARSWAVKDSGGASAATRSAQLFNAAIVESLSVW